MNYQAICIYCICSDIVEEYGANKDDPQCHMTTAEILCFLVISAMYYGCNYKTTRLVCQSHNWFSRLLSHSRLIRRIHALPEGLFQATLAACSAAFSGKEDQVYIVDSFPVASCQSYKSWRRKLFKDSKYHGYCASKKQFYFGIKVHVITNQKGVPIEIVLTAASENDVRAFKRFELDLPKGSVIYADRAYTDYSDEELILSCTGIRLTPKRKANYKRQHSGTINFLLSAIRNRIETSFSGFLERFPRTIRAKTEKGFCIKVILLIIGSVFLKRLPNT